MIEEQHKQDNIIQNNEELNPDDEDDVEDVEDDEELVRCVDSELRLSNESYKNLLLRKNTTKIIIKTNKNINLFIYIYFE